MLDRFPGWTIDDVMGLTYDQIDFLMRGGRPRKSGIPILSPADIPRAAEKMHRRKLREIFGN